jgi:hypothetical protein
MHDTTYAQKVILLLLESIVIYYGNVFQIKVSNTKVSLIQKYVSGQLKRHICDSPFTFLVGIYSRQIEFMTLNHFLKRMTQGHANTRAHAHNNSNTNTNNTQNN